MKHHKLFSDKADIYERARPHYPNEVFSYLASLCKETKTVWDCACGNGQAAVGLVEEFDSVYATDVSEEQISNAKMHPRIDYSVSASEQTKLVDNSLDMVCVAQALHWFDYDLFWPEVSRVLKPGGVFAALGYNLPSIEPQIDDLIQEKILDVLKPYWAPQNQLIWDHYRDIEFPFKRVDAPQFGLTTSWDLDELFDFIHSFSATRRYMDQAGDAFFRDAYKEATAIWGDVRLKRLVDFDFVFYVGLHE